MNTNNTIDTDTTTRTPTKKIAGVALAIVLAVAVLSGCLSKNQQTLQDQVNISRKLNQMPALKSYTPANEKAQAYAEYLASKSTGNGSDLVHSNLPDGYVSGTWCTLGENIGMVLGNSVKPFGLAFLNSPTHRANILKSIYTHVGTGAATSKKTGYTYVVVEFVKVC